jgi:hypothetical protein
MIMLLFYKRIRYFKNKLKLLEKHVTYTEVNITKTQQVNGELHQKNSLHRQIKKLDDQTIKLLKLEIDRQKTINLALLMQNNKISSYVDVSTQSQRFFAIKQEELNCFFTYSEN